MIKRRSFLGFTCSSIFFPGFLKGDWNQNYKNCIREHDKFIFWDDRNTYVCTYFTDKPTISFEIENKKYKYCTFPTVTDVFITIFGKNDKLENKYNPKSSYYEYTYRGFNINEEKIFDCLYEQFVKDKKKLFAWFFDPEKTNTEERFSVDGKKLILYGIYTKYTNSLGDIEHPYLNEISSYNIL